MGTKNKKKNIESLFNHPLEMEPVPKFVQHRITMFNKLKAIAFDEISKKPQVSIQISLSDGSKFDGISWKTTPLEIAKSIDQHENILIAKVNGILWDLDRPLESSCNMDLLNFEHEEAKMVFWHSSAHMLGEACERHYDCHLCIGPPLKDGGFYYEMDIENRVANQQDYPNLEKLVNQIAKEKQPFERLVISKNDLLEMFKHNPYKVHIIKNKISDDSLTTIYRCGPLIDLCRGPHIPHTGHVKTFSITKNSSSYFLGNPKNASLQRVYGISFPDKKQMVEYKKFMAEAAKRDHRKIGKEQELFFFHEVSPGSAFMLPHGTQIYNALINLAKEEYQVRGFTEVITPNMFNVKLWNQSGHALKYKDNMFCLQVDKEEFGLKPMNCPGHCLMFAHKERSYRELPIRFADFGVLHRDEFSGSLSGLTRVRRFQQDDAHIFCRVDQIEQEMDGCFDFLNHIYGVFGFDFSLKLSTRPENYLGELKIWENAEKMLADSLDRFCKKMGISWNTDTGDGAFYGPKIDITIKNALGRSHQCATIQLDFQLPERFKLKYRTEETVARPVIIHRAILGSVERMMGILIEHFAGKFPFWLSPRQVQVIPVATLFFGYAKQVQQRLVSKGIYADVDLTDNTLNKKIRNAELLQYNFMFVVGEIERNNVSVHVRNRDDGKGSSIPLDLVVEKLQFLKDSRSLQNKL